MLLSIPTDKEFFSIGEVCRITGIQPHVLRYWESAIGLVRPARRGSGHRRFSRKDVLSLVQVRELVQGKGLTLAGVKKHLRAEAKRGPTQVPLALAESSAAVEVLRGVRQELAALVKDLYGRTDGAA
jgi:DNA-binding transcriptional MerR regulator